MISTETRTAAGILTLTALRGIGPATAERLANNFRPSTRSSAPSLRSFDRRLGRRGGCLHEPIAILNASEKAQRVLDEADRRGVRVLSIFDANYPDALRSLADRPPIVFSEG